MRPALSAVATALMVGVLVDAFVHRAAVVFATEVTRQVEELLSARDTDALNDRWEEHERGEHEEPVTGCPECVHDLAMEAR